MTLKTDQKMAKDDHRRNFLKTSAALAVAGVSAGKLELAHAQSTPGIKGQVAPELDIDYWIDANGEPTTFSIADSEGKWILLKCFQNWCPGCHKYGFPTLKAFSDRFHDNPRVAIAGIQTVFEGHSVNTQEAVRDLQLRYELPITMGHDPGNAETHARPNTMRDYKTGGTPWIILINPEGVVTHNAFHAPTEQLIAYVERQIS